MTTKTILITSGSGTFTVPSDFISLVSIESIGAGAGNPYAGSAVGPLAAALMLRVYQQAARI